MSCNCMTSEQLNQLYREFGVKNEEFKNLSFAQKVKYYTIKSGVAIMMVAITPLIIIYVLYKRFFGDGKISLRNFFGLKERNIVEYVRYQQELQSQH